MSRKVTTTETNGIPEPSYDVGYLENDHKRYDERQRDQLISSSIDCVWTETLGSCLAPGPAPLRLADPGELNHY
jgi:hypothetical protein